ncbi:uncharacterized protein V6R79_003329 [Siganus canaliculatus]
MSEDQAPQAAAVSLLREADKEDADEAQEQKGAKIELKTSRNDNSDKVQELDIM